MVIPFKTPAVAIAAVLLAASGYSLPVMASTGAPAHSPGQVHEPDSFQTAQNGRGDRQQGRDRDQTGKKNVPATPARKPDGARDRGQRRTRPESNAQRPSVQRTRTQREVVRDRRERDRAAIRNADRPHQGPVTRDRLQTRRENVLRERRARYQSYHRNYNAPRRYRVDQYRWGPGRSYRRYGYGQRLPSYYYGRSFWLTSFVIYGLFAPPSGLIWVRYGPDALLIDQETGEIVQVRYNMFYS